MFIDTIFKTHVTDKLQLFSKLTCNAQDSHLEQKYPVLGIHPLFFHKPDDSTCPSHAEQVKSRACSLPCRQRKKMNCVCLVTFPLLTCSLAVKWNLPDWQISLWSLLYRHHKGPKLGTVCRTERKGKNRK